MDSNTKHRLPYLRLSSAPKAGRSCSDQLIATAFESNSCRYLGEHLSTRVFQPLPFALTNVIGSMNERNFFRHWQTSQSDTQYCRPYPQGTVVQLSEKSLHDDCNGVTIPGLWQCMKEDLLNPVTLTFTTTTISWTIQSTEARFALFKGLIPHRTSLTNPPLVPSPHKRMSHSSYWKMDHEYMALVLMSEENCKKLEIESPEV